MRTEALLADYASKYSFHGLDLVFYMQDETRYKLTPQDKMTAASFQNLLDTFVRSGSTKTVNKFSVSVPASAFTCLCLYCCLFCLRLCLCICGICPYACPEIFPVAHELLQASACHALTTSLRSRPVPPPAPSPWSLSFGFTRLLCPQEPNPLAWSWKPVTDSPNYLVFDSALPAYPTNLDVADITAALGEAAVRMTYDYHSPQCSLWAQDGIDLLYASAA